MLVPHSRGALCLWGLFTMCWRCFWFELNTDRKPYVWALQRGRPTQPHTHTQAHTFRGRNRHLIFLLGTERGSSQTHRAVDTRLHVCDHTEDSPNIVYAWYKHHISTSCLWCTLQKKVATIMKPKITTHNFWDACEQLYTLKYRQSFLVCCGREG